MPLVSIITPLHNKGAYIAETIASLHGQTMADWEMLVVENHSTDDGPEQVERIAAGDPRIRLIRAPDTVRGPGAARNLGLDRCRGAWVLFLDADDLLAGEHLESLLQAGRSKAADVVASDWVEFVEGTRDDIASLPLDDGVSRVLNRQHAAGSLEPTPRITVQDSSIAYAPWAVHCALVRRKALDAERRWVEALDRHPSEDTAFWFRVLWGRVVAYTRRATAIYRTETPNFRNTHRELRRWAEAMQAIHTENLHFLDSVSHGVNAHQAECLMRVWSRLGAEATGNGDPALSDTAFHQAEKWKRQTGWTTPGMFLRQIIGCRWSERLASTLLRILEKVR